MLSKTVDESRVETVRIVRPNHLNGANRLFGGEPTNSEFIALIADKLQLQLKSSEVANF